MRIALLLLAVCLSTGALAGTAEDARKELSSTLAAIKQSDKKQKELARRTEQLQTELKRLQEEMAEMGKNTTLQEEDLSSHEEKLAILEEQKRKKTQALHARETELDAMISAMIKLRQLPPEAIIAMPGKLDETLSTARALGTITQAIESESRSLKAQLRELDALEDKIRRSRENVASRKMSLADRQAALAAKMKERSALVEVLGGKEKRERERVAKLTAKSQNLQELVDSLQKSEYSWKASDAEGAKRKKSGHKIRSFTDARGRIRLPAAGKVVSRFGNLETSAAFAKGIVIETRSDASVVAPFDGEVVFAGPFRDYGRMVIIRHSSDYHTLLSGLENIHCKPGQYLLEGEPIGTMSVGGSHRLYMELREDGKPVDPSGWLKG